MHVKCAEIIYIDCHISYLQTDSNLSNKIKSNHAILDLCTLVISVAKAL
jgi:hypothetical protein